jgi:hypothetical protein
MRSPRGRLGGVRFTVVKLVVLAVAASACASGNPSSQPAAPHEAQAPAVSPSAPRASNEAPEPEPKPLVTVLAIEVRRRAPDGSVEEGDRIDPDPYVAVFAPPAAELRSCVSGGTEPTLAVEVTASGAVGNVETLVNAPACLEPLVRELTFPACKHAVALTVVFTP